MQTHALGNTNHESTIAMFGAITLNWLEQEDAGQMVGHVLSKDVSHFDMVPTYGDTELKPGPKLRQHREDIFLDCKTQERSCEGAKRKLDRSSDHLGIDYIDLYQVHGLGYESELGEVTVDNGAFTAFRETKDEGKIDHIGLASHGNPELTRDTIDHIDSLKAPVFPLNPAVVGKGDDERDYEGIFEAAEKTGIGTLGIRVFARDPWPDTDELPGADRSFPSWYEPVDTPNEVAGRFDFAAAQGLTNVVMPGDPKLVAMVLNAAVRYSSVGETAQRSLIERLRHDKSPMPEQLHH